MMRRLHPLGRISAAALLASLIAACGPTEYEPAAGFQDTGYETEQLGPDRYMVSFEGNDVTDRETVETYLLYRAAEIARQTGHAYFAFVDQVTEREVDVNSFYTSPGLYGYGPGWGLASTYRFPYYGTLSYGGYAGAPVTTSDSFDAFAAVEMFEQRPDDRNDVFETSDVLRDLRDEVETG
ncbi:MAG: hypothetical protein ACFB22_02555 [Rhodothalassiaceae bacterium]